jgi:DNA-binding CsgD family transcriptional regulator
MGADHVNAAADERFVDAVEAIYAAAPDPSRWPQALQAMAGVFGDVGAILIWQRDDGGFGTIVSPTLAEAQKEYQEGGWYRRDTRAIRAVERSLWLRSDAVTDHDAASDEEMATDPFYTEFLARHGLRWCAALGLAPDPHIRVAMSIQRASDKPPYSYAELAVATRLGRHAEKSLRLGIRLLDADLTKLSLGEALGRLGIAVFALDSLGRVVFSNPAAIHLAGQGIEITGGRLRFASVEQRPAVDHAIRQVLRARPQDLVADIRPILVHRFASDRPLVVYLLPIATQPKLAEDFLTHTRAIVLVIEPKSDEPPDPALVRDILDLTLGEARVAALVGSGLAPREAAEKLGITEETARTALKRVFSKVGVSRQSELAALLTKLVLR